jgi:hypothetical protein
MARIQDVSPSVEAAVPVVEVNDHNNNNEVQQTFVSLADLIQQQVKEQVEFLLKQTSAVSNEKITGNLESVTSKPAALGRPHFDKFKPLDDQMSTLGSVKRS